MCAAITSLVRGSTLAAQSSTICARWRELTRILPEASVRCTTQSQADHKEARGSVRTDRSRDLGAVENAHLENRTWQLSSGFCACVTRSRSFRKFRAAAGEVPSVRSPGPEWQSWRVPCSGLNHLLLCCVLNSKGPQGVLTRHRQSRIVYDFFCRFAQRFLAAWDISLLRSSGVTLLQRAGPPRLPRALITAFNSRLLGFLGFIDNQSRSPSFGSKSTHLGPYFPVDNNVLDRLALCKAV